MTGYTLLRRLVIAFLVAVLLAVCFDIVRAQDDDDPPSDDEYWVYYYVYQQGGCAALTPYGYWWFFWNCHNQNGLTVQSTSLTLTEDTAESTVVYSDGSTVRTVGPTRRRK